ncbi:MAG: OsmC family protein [Planctomycetes bacterium]|nr:OsmC family protein [Planctomycetota bacterium]
MAVVITGVYQGSLTSEATHEQSGAKLSATAPLDNGGLGNAFSPTDLVATGLGTCMLTIMGIWAAKHDLTIEGTTFRVEKHMSEDTPRRIVRLPIQFDVRGNVPAAKRAAMEAAGMKCPVKQSLAGFIDVEVVFNYLES